MDPAHLTPEEAAAVVFLIEYVGGPRDGECDDYDGEPVAFTGGVYDLVPVRRLDAVNDTPERRVMAWHPAPGGRRNRPACAEPCSPGCPAAPAAP